MARAPRGSGSRWRTSRTPSLDLPGTLGSLLRTTIEQVGAMRDAMERQARSSRGRLGSVVLQRRRRDALARLGEQVYALAIDGRLDEVADDADTAELLAAVEAVDDELAGAGGFEPAGDDYEAVSSASYRADARRSSRGESTRVWRPVMPDDETDGEVDGERMPRSRAASRAAGTRDERVPWESVAAGDHQDQRRPGEPAPGERRERRGKKRGGIAFVADQGGDADDDLSEYMHPDDVGTRRDD